MKSKMRSDIAWSSRTEIKIHGYDLVRDVIGHVNFGDIAFLEIMGRLPENRESIMFNALLVTLVEHGITPSSLATRLTYTGAPEALQGAVAAGLLGLGSVFVGSIGDAAMLLAAAIPNPQEEVHYRPLAKEIVDRFRQEKRGIPGLGHPIHKPSDPRTERLFEIARETNFHGPYVMLMREIAECVSSYSSKPITLNATGAIGALCCEMKIPAEITRGVGIMSRSIGLVGHILEEQRNPIGVEVWRRTDDEATSHIRDSSNTDIK